MTDNNSMLKKMIEDILENDSTFIKLKEDIKRLEEKFDRVERVQENNLRRKANHTIKK
jgi:hypothetical protein